MGAFTPFIPAAAQAALGIGQMLFSGRKKANRELDALTPPTAEGSRSIQDYYSKALQRYNVAPTDSAMYKRQARNVMRGTAQGLGALRDRGSALAGVNRLIAGQNQGMLNAEVMAEQDRNRRFGELRGAVGMQTEDERRLYQLNKLMPFQRKDRLAQMKLAAANARMDAGISNIFGAGGTASMLFNPPK